MPRRRHPFNPCAMIDSRRDFIKQAALLAGGTGLLGALPASVQKALAINPAPGTTFEDAEHVVLLMQENRSFDHCYGSLRGVRGFHDPRAIDLPNGSPVWLQTNKAAETYAPFRLDIKDTKATWMSSLPHSWTNQVRAANGGRHDGWLDAKRSGHKAYADMPLTMGFYNREDIPFYYALADAFTVCDQHFCSSLTGTTPNRLFFWTGTIREKPVSDSPANVDNSDVDYDSPASWTTFPERLEEAGISWKVYQNELSIDTGLEGAQEEWLANFTDNPLEWFTQYSVRHHPAHIRYMEQRVKALPAEIASLQGKDTKEARTAIAKKTQELKALQEALQVYGAKPLPEQRQRIHDKAFTTNTGDPDYRNLDDLEYEDNGVSRRMQVPKGDVLHQFREDVSKGQLPTVSWLVAPENFSDHPGAPWYGAWYVSEVLDILTRNPEVWKKTILILTYDENDGYFDHVPPFAAPEPGNPKSGKCSGGVDTTPDYVTPAEVSRLKGQPKDPEMPSPIGLGFRVPMVVASPWSRGGWVNSQVFDHTSVLQFLEGFVHRRSGKSIREENISDWRRTVCGDLSSVFRPYNGETIELPPFVEKQPFVESIFNAQFKALPAGFRRLDTADVEAVKQGRGVSVLPVQEPGLRPSCALPYEPYADGHPSSDGRSFVLRLEAGNRFFGDRSAGIPFKVYDMVHYGVRDYAVRAGDRLTDTWTLEPGPYHFRVYGPNGFFREFRGLPDPAPEVRCGYETAGRRPTGRLRLELQPAGTATHTIEIRDNAYGAAPLTRTLKAGRRSTLVLDLKEGQGWYDLSIGLQGRPDFSRRYAGRVETGKAAVSDPVMARPRNRTNH